MKKISQRMILSIVPIFILALAIVTMVVSLAAKKSIGVESYEKMNALMESAENRINSILKEPEAITLSIADVIGQNEKAGADLSKYGDVMGKYILENDCIVAMGFFMEPELWGYNADTGEYKEMFNLYWTEDGNEAPFIDIGQNDSLTGTEWFKTLKEQGGVFYTETYIDNTMGILMTSYVVPVYDKSGKFIGCVNTDIDMTAVQDIVNEVRVGETGHCMLVTTDTGEFVAGVSPEKTLNEELTIYTDEEIGLIAQSETIMTEEEYTCRVSNVSGKYDFFSNRFSTYNWILLTQIDAAEIDQPVTRIMTDTIFLSLVATIICAIIIIIVAKRLSRGIVNVQAMADTMAAGDFTIEHLKVNGQDELASMTNALNKMLDANKIEMGSISDNAMTISDNSETLKNAVSELESSFEGISNAISQISGAMMDNNATTEELTASVAEVRDAVENLAVKAKESETMSLEIMNRAKGINKESTESYDKAMSLTKQYEVELNESIENSKVVEEIGIMADAINDIAEQINLLSLNASIEAARAGEAGKGFAVVASEIGNLAAQTSKTVQSIQETIIKVRDAVSTLSDNSGKIITFINESVNPDYQAFVDVSVKYEQDAIEIKSLSEYVSSIADTLNHTMGEFNEAIDNIANMSQNTTESSADVLGHVDIVANNVRNVDEISKGQIEVAKELNEVVSRYKF